MIHLHLLPSELLLHIFQHLPYRDLNSLVLVSRRLRYLAEDPLLWRNFHFQISSKLCQEAAQLDSCVLTVRRLANISHTLVWGYGMSEENVINVINSLRKKKSVSHIRFTNINLSQIDQEVLSSFIVRLTAVILDLNYLTSAQVKAIFEKVCEVSPVVSSLKHLDLCYNSVLGVPPPLLTSSLARLTSLRLIQVQISELQVETMMRALAGRHSLEALELQGVSLATLQPPLFSAALSNLRNVVIHNTFGYNLTAQQLSQLAQQTVNNKKRKLKYFTLVLADLSEVEIPTLEGFLKTDVRVRLTDCSLSEAQYQHLNRREEIHINNFGCDTSFNLSNFQKSN